MVAYGFQNRFAPKIESGEKKQTIRALRKNRHTKPGEPMQLYKGMRTKMCRKIIPDPICQKVIDIFIDHHGWNVILDGKSLSDYEIYQLARKDGFATITKFFRYFVSLKKPHFEGVLIIWL